MVTTSKPKPKAVPPAEHHIQFELCGPNFAPLSHSRSYRLSWKNMGEKQEQTAEGTTDADGKTAVVKTKGKVQVTLDVAPPDGSQCKLVGSVSSRPLDKKPLVKVQLKVLVAATSEPKPMNMCETFDVRVGKQQIQFVINNVPKYKSYPTYLTTLPYYVVNADTFEVISDSIGPPKTAYAMQGSKTQVSTAVFNVDGIKKVGIVLGSATDDPARWPEKDGQLVFYRVAPKEAGLTQVVIEEESAPGVAFDRAIEVKDYKATLNGNVWATMCRAFSTADVKKMLPGGLTISTRTPTEMQIAYALAKGVITAEQAAAYRADRNARLASSTKATEKPAQAKAQPLVALSYWCSWSELLEPIFTGQIVDGSPANPQVPDIDPQTKKQKKDPKTQQPLTKDKYSKDEYLKFVQMGEGKIVIEPLGLTLELAGRIGTGGEPFAENAHEITGLGKAEILSRTHPLTYVALLEACHDCSVHYVRIGCTWRPMIGSTFHKLGDALDVGKIDSESNPAQPFTFLNVKVNRLADKFTRALDAHRYAKPGKTIYNADNLPANADGHHNHLHFTADRLKQIAEQDKSLPRTPVEQSAQRAAGSTTAKAPEMVK